MHPSNCGAWWLIGRFVAFHSKGRRFESCSSCHVGNLGKSFTCSSLWRFSFNSRLGQKFETRFLLHSQPSGGQGVSPVQGEAIRRRYIIPILSYFGSSSRTGLSQTTNQI